MATIYHGGTPVKSFSWSYSKLKNYENCPKQYYHVDVEKEFKDEPVDPDGPMAYGNRVHAMLADAIAGKAPLPAMYEADFKPWVERVQGGMPGTVLVEQQYAITSDFQPTAWFGRNAWFRAKADVVKLNGPVGIVIDWKTGKILEDSVQLALTAAVMFIHNPEVKAIRSIFAWLKDNAETPEDFKRSDVPLIFGNLMPRIKTLENAHKTTTFPAKPSGLCRWCPVGSCPHNKNAGAKK